MREVEGGTSADIDVVVWLPFLDVIGSPWVDDLASAAYGHIDGDLVRRRAQPAATAARAGRPDCVGAREVGGFFGSLGPHRGPIEWLFGEVYMPAQDMATTLQFLEWALQAFVRDRVTVPSHLHDGRAREPLESILWGHANPPGGVDERRWRRLMTAHDDQAISARLLVVDARAAIAWQSLMRNVSGRALAWIGAWCGAYAREAGFPQPFLPPPADVGTAPSVRRRDPRSRVTRDHKMGVTNSPGATSAPQRPRGPDAAGDSKLSRQAHAT